MKPLRLLLSDSFDPWFNLAVEECIFRQMTTQRVLFLWRNAETVVIGQAQNPWKECNTRRMEQDGIRLARRSSGGGAVFHDLGNTCFTFMAGKPEYDKSVSTGIILNALKALGIDASASGRNDLVVQTCEGERKISGSAYRETADRGFHHGTLLLNADLSRLANYLNPDVKKLQAKGITSVRSRVANLNEFVPDIHHDQICAAVTDAFFDWYGQRVEPEIISPDVSLIYPVFRNGLPNKAAGNGILVKRRLSATNLTNALSGGAWISTLMWKRAISAGHKSSLTASIRHLCWRWLSSYPQHGTARRMFHWPVTKSLNN